MEFSNVIACSSQSSSGRLYEFTSVNRRNDYTISVYVLFTRSLRSVGSVFMRYFPRRHVEIVCKYLKIDRAGRVQFRFFVKNSNILDGRKKNRSYLPFLFGFDQNRNGYRRFNRIAYSIYLKPLNLINWLLITYHWLLGRFSFSDFSWSPCRLLMQRRIIMLLPVFAVAIRVWWVMLRTLQNITKLVTLHYKTCVLAT